MVNKLSLSNRLLIAVSLVLTAFFGLSAVSLNNAFESSAEHEQKKRLQNYVYTLLTAADINASGELVMSADLAEPKFSIPNSGLYAQITQQGEIVWQSPSAIGHFLALPFTPEPSQEEYHVVEMETGMSLLNLAFGIVWETDEGKEIAYTINVAEDMQVLKEQTASFQRSLWYWLGGTGLMLLIAQWIILRWSLRPLYDVAIDLHAIETGEHRRLNDEYPKELQQLTFRINALLDHEESRRQRYKHSLADLAHSLKTPLSVFRGELENSDNMQQLRKTGYEQLDRISTLVDYQLQRASTEGKSSLLAPVSLGEIIYKITSSLDKVYQSKTIRSQCEIERDAYIHADEGDMYELLGNLLENAYKYCKHQVHVIVTTINGNVRIRVEDDGSGIPARAEGFVIKRGHRIDTQAEGQGLGLAIVSDIIVAYEGNINLERSRLGGASFVIELPRQ
ncbi:ATP-binding protein [Methylophaga sp. OBS1]|uniref:ATP-binding protein n=1 Tax=Methylophaga sp. OBS1 TaxID=2991933 RepID=UPI002250085C|nr:ATP-binding protein [Methylophaga sp. OBS1]MCX4191163.1 ATP-binding protein [Methylophaga sp. OBS1]MCX4191891.1 ATP-binding protein [Methylophaga sp. OBS1]